MVRVAGPDADDQDFFHARCSILLIVNEIIAGWRHFPRFLAG